MSDTSKTKLFFSNKAVADGAISYYVDHFVQTRVSKLTYGSRVGFYYDPNVPEHQNRPISTSILSGDKLIDVVGFSVILSGVSRPLVLHLRKENYRDY